MKDRLKASGLTLSGGQQQRLCIARAVAVQPEVILMDEPAPRSTPISTLAIEDLMRELKRDYTIIVVTHKHAAGGAGLRPDSLHDDGRGPRRISRRGRGDHADIHESQDERTEGYITGRFG